MSERLSVAKTYKLFINGGFPRTESGRSIAVSGPGGAVLAHVSHGSRKDVRDAVEAAAAAQPRWAAATAYNRGQVMYRMAEMLEGKRDEFIHILQQTTRRGQTSRSSAGRTASARTAREVDASIDRLVCFAGWADKYSQVLGCNNPVAGPYYNFTVPEPTGVVVAIAPPCPPGPALLGWISLMAPPLCAGNAVVVIADDAAMLPAAVFGEVCATSDVPAGLVNIITGKRSELLEHIAQHRNVNAVSAANLPRKDSTVLKLGVADNLKRVHVATIEDWFDHARCEGPWMIEPFAEMKTIWHPSAV